MTAGQSRAVVPERERLGLRNEISKLCGRADDTRQGWEAGPAR